MPLADIFACFEVLLNRAYRFLCGPCISCCSTWEYIDTEFEGDTALGDGKAADWVRARELFGQDKDGHPVKPKLYEGKIEVSSCFLKHPRVSPMTC